MDGLKGARVAVVGGGAFGLVTALFAARAGASVRLYQPYPLGVGASGVAAGMLAPALEAATEDLGARDFAILRHGRRLWAETEALAALVDASGAVYADVGDGSDAAMVAQRLTHLGAEVQDLDGAAGRRVAPWLGAAAVPRLFLPGEGRVNPLAVLRALVGELGRAGGDLVNGSAPTGPQAWAEWAPAFDAVVIAAGYDSRRWSPIYPSLNRLTPIKGHILHFAGGPRDGPVVRSAHGYVAPQTEGACFGATMQVGQADADIEPDCVQRLEAGAVRLVPDLAAYGVSPRAGVRAATPDGRPMAGQLGRGVYVATGARRNGWLLAPLVAEAVVAAMAGEAAPAHAGLMVPTRFD